ncbi:hypothetical protein Misp01_05010 [Microtetraspora sp. NBRC 13810]|nr:hypothetical protein Misp01_05010 [Microtetraspora sp. NBRC 13810]
MIPALTGPRTREPPRAGGTGTDPYGFRAGAGGTRTGLGRSRAGAGGAYKGFGRSRVRGPSAASVSLDHRLSCFLHRVKANCLHIVMSRAKGC